MGNIDRTERAALIIAAAPETDMGYIKGLYQEYQPFVICADGGLVKARQLDIVCDVSIGDMDSMQGGKVDCMLQKEKDFSDTQACIREALNRGFRKILIAGALGGRIDHTLCNLFLLEQIARAGAYGEVHDAHNLVRVAADGVYRVPREYRYFSIIPLDSTLTAVCITGSKYDLLNKTVYRGDSLTLSNEPVAETVKISLSGAALLVFSKD